MNIAATRLALHRLGAELTAFSAWWIHEVREAWLFLVERIWPAHSRRFLLELDDSGGIVRQIATSVVKTSGVRFELTEDRSLPALSTFWTEGAPASARVFVALPQSKVLLCNLQLPPVSDLDLARMIDLQLERELPLPRDQVNVDWEADQRRGNQPRRVEVAIAKQVDVNRLRGEIQSWGWQVAAVGLGCGTDTPRFDLLPPRLHRLNFSMGRREWHLFWSALALCGACVLTIGGQWWYERSSLSAQLRDARSQAEKIERQRATLADRGKPVIALRELMRSASAAQVLTAMSTAVPANSWIYQTEIRTPAAANPSVKLEGYTTAAAALVEALQQHPEFEQVQLVRSSAAGVASGVDRVELTARMRRLQQP